VEIREQRTVFDEFGGQVAEIQALLEEQRGEVKLRDLVEGESERLVDNAIETERAMLDNMQPAKVARRADKARPEAQRLSLLWVASGHRLRRRKRTFSRRRETFGGRPGSACRVRQGEVAPPRYSKAHPEISLVILVRAPPAVDLRSAARTLSRSASNRHLLVESKRFLAAEVSDEPIVDYDLNRVRIVGVGRLGQEARFTPDIESMAIVAATDTTRIGEGRGRTKQAKSLRSVRDCPH
jgi:hypothetical protein